MQWLTLFQGAARKDRIQTVIDSDLHKLVAGCLHSGGPLGPSRVNHPTHIKEGPSIMNRHSLIGRGLAAARCALCVTPTFASSVAFYSVGQLPGGKANSQIRDAVLDNDEIVAVSFATQNPASQDNPGGSGDTAVLWTLKDGLVALPADVPGMTP